MIVTLVMLGVLRAKHAKPSLIFFYLFNQACSKHMDIQVVAELDDKYREGKQEIIHGLGWPL
jgi:hypothetical protein